MMMGTIAAQDLLWFAVRVKRTQIGGVRTITVGGDFEAYKARNGQVRKRRVLGTGDRVFLPEHLLRRAGFEVFLPIEKKSKRKNRFSKDRHMVSYPLLVDWLFVGVPAGYDAQSGRTPDHRIADLLKLDVVTGLMGLGGKPALIPQRKIHAMMRQWGGGALSAQMHRWSRSDVPFAPGDQIRVIAGPWADLESKIIGVSGASVKVMAQMFGRDFPVEFHAQDIEKV